MRTALAKAFDRVVVAAEPHVDRAEQFPALAVVGVRGEMRLDPRDQRGDVLLSGGAARRAASGWSGRSGRAEQRDRGRARRSAWRRWRRPRRARPRPLAGAARAGAASSAARSSRRAISVRAAAGLAVGDQARADVAVEFARAGRDRSPPPAPPPSPAGAAAVERHQHGREAAAASTAMTIQRTIARCPSPRRPRSAPQT